jgi:hypothetical protein
VGQIKYYKNTVGESAWKLAAPMEKSAVLEMRVHKLVPRARKSMAHWKEEREWDGLTGRNCGWHRRGVCRIIRVEGDIGGQSVSRRVCPDVDWCAQR